MSENEKRTKVITLANQKGGVAKTTSCQMLGCCLANQGKKVLVVDMDAQENLTSAFADANDRKRMLNKTVYHALKKSAEIEDCIFQVEDNLDIVPGSIQMSAADLEFNVIGREVMLKELLDQVKDGYDYVLIDTPPSLGIASVNALVAADSVIIPMCAAKFSVGGFSQLMSTIGQVRLRFNPQLRVEGVLITQYSTNNDLQKFIREQLQEQLSQNNILCFTSAIRTGKAIQEAQADGLNPITQEDRRYKRSGAVLDYKAFLKEFLENEERSRA